MPDETFLFVKENQPSLGSNPFNVNTLGTFSGYVYDVYDNPVVNAEIHYYPSNWESELYTDETGYFGSNVYGMNYSIMLKINNIEYAPMDITVEPDSITFVEFFTDYDPANAENEELQFPNYSIYNFPNPFNPATTIYFESAKLLEDSRIEIYNSKGQLVEQLRITNYESGIYEVIWNAKEFSSGVYYYSFFTGDAELASNKMLLLK